MAQSRRGLASASRQTRARVARAGGKAEHSTRGRGRTSSRGRSRSARGR